MYFKATKEEEKIAKNCIHDISMAASLEADSALILLYALHLAGRRGATGITM
jgi:hypothetical protein